MKTVPTTNGLAYGSEHDELDIIPIVGALRRTAVESLATPSQDIDALDPEMARRIPDRRGSDRIMLIDRGRQIIIRLRWRAGESPTAPLARIVEREQAQGTPPPAWITFVVFVAARLHGRASYASQRTAVRMAALQAAEWERTPETAMDPLAPAPNAAEIRDAARRTIHALLSGAPLPLPKSPLGRGRWAAALSRLIWEPEEARILRTGLLAAFERDHAPPHATLQMLIQTGALWLHPLATPPRIAGAPLDAPPPSPLACAHLWANFLALLDATEAEARALLTPWRARDMTDAPIDEPWGAAPPRTPDRELAHALARRFTSDAAEHAAYAPQGVWDVRLPSGLPLRDWGVDRVRLVFLRPQRVWAALTDVHGATIAAFPWNPVGDRSWTGEASLTLPSWAWPTVDLTIAALWHDLCVAGEAASPTVDLGSAAPRARPQRSPAAGRSPAPPPAPSLHPSRPALLPRVVRSSRADVRDWGTTDDQAVIRRRVAALCAVRGHYRRHAYVGDSSDDPRRRAEADRLRREAAARAAQYGLPPPPPGYTFVAPFVRGAVGDRRAEDGAVDPREVRVKGLATLMAVMRHAVEATERSETTPDDAPAARSVGRRSEHGGGRRRGDG